MAALNCSKESNQVEFKDCLRTKRHSRSAIWLEQEPGSGGKESAQATVRNLSGFVAHAEPVTGSKETRAEPFAAQAEAGNVYLVRDAWNAAYLDELCTFPAGRYKDQVDASSGAFNKLAAGPSGVAPPPMSPTAGLNIIDRTRRGGSLGYGAP